jgi:tRNA threonylcarbamoyl adenosine modification protein (Sua5/YciO/YrdC/YwlC family)
VPILLLLAEVEQAVEVAAAIPPGFGRLAKKFWPGPLTIVVPAKGHLPAPLTAGTGTIGLRVPGLRLPRAVSLALGRPITGTSANRSGVPAASTVGGLSQALGEGYGGLGLVLDSGPTPGAPASTVVDLSGDVPRLIRPGAVAWEAVLAALGRPA